MSPHKRGLRWCALISTYSIQESYFFKQNLQFFYNQFPLYYVILYFKVIRKKSTVTYDRLPNNKFKPGLKE